LSHPPKAKAPTAAAGGGGSSAKERTSFASAHMVSKPSKVRLTLPKVSVTVPQGSALASAVAVVNVIVVFSLI